MTLESRKLGMIIYGLLVATMLFLYQAQIDLAVAAGLVAPIAVYAFADQLKNRNSIKSSTV